MEPLAFCAQTMDAPNVFKPSDQEVADRIASLLTKLINSHPDVRGDLWRSAFYALTAHAYMNSGLTYEDFCASLDGAKEYYKDNWKK
jgi:hypothetical protein